MPDIVTFSEQEIQRAIADRAYLLALQKARKTRSLDGYFLASGPYRRELYGKHLSFFRAGGYHVPMDSCPAGCDGSPHRERCLLAGNRCITPWTPIEMGSSTRQCRELISSGDFDVQSWDGSSRCRKKASGLFLKGIEPAFRIHLDNGQEFDCTYRHRVLVSGESSKNYWVEIGQLVRGVSGLRLRKTSPYSPANCDTASYPYGGQLQWGGVISLDGVPLSGHAHRRNPCSWNEDEEEPKSQYSRVYPTFSPLSILDDPDQISALCAHFEDPGIYISSLWSSRELQAVRRFADELALQPQVHKSEGLNPIYSLASGSEFLSEGDKSSVWFPFSHSPIVNNAHIQYIIPLGCQSILDFTVDGTECYETAGVIHHNTGKTKAAGCEFVFHATGQYPEWWEGGKFDSPTLQWACNDTNKNTRDINQLELLGPSGQYGTGLLPTDTIIDTKVKPGIADAVEFIHVRHSSGGVSVIQFKSYEQGWEAFTGAAVHVIWCDEEPPLKVYTECCIRTMTTSGLIMLTFTPLQGTTEVVKGFLDSYTGASSSPVNINTQSDPEKSKTEPVERVDPRKKRI